MRIILLALLIPCALFASDTGDTNKIFAVYDDSHQFDRDLAFINNKLGIPYSNKKKGKKDPNAITRSWDIKNEVTEKDNVTRYYMMPNEHLPKPKKYTLRKLDPKNGEG